MKIAFYGSSLLVGIFGTVAATYYRGILSGAGGEGPRHHLFRTRCVRPTERTAISSPRPGLRTRGGVSAPDRRRCAANGTGRRGCTVSDVVVKASGVGINDDAAAAPGCCVNARPDALRIFWDVDAPATLAGAARRSCAPVARRPAEALTLILTYGGGAPVIDAYRDARRALTCIPIYNALDPATHHPVAPEARLRCRSRVSLAIACPIAKRARGGSSFCVPASLLRLHGSELVCWAASGLGRSSAVSGECP